VLLALLWVPAIVFVPLLLLLFPDGTLGSPSWRWVLGGYLVIGACWLACIYTVAIATITGHRIQVDAGGYLTIIDRPAGSAALADARAGADPCPPWSCSGWYSPPAR
jgi:hypothetical protein